MLIDGASPTPRSCRELFEADWRHQFQQRNYEGNQTNVLFHAHPSDDLTQDPICAGSSKTFCSPKRVELMSEM